MTCREFCQRQFVRIFPHTWWSWSWLCPGSGYFQSNIRKLSEMMTEDCKGSDTEILWYQDGQWSWSNTSGQQMDALGDITIISHKKLHLLCLFCLFQVYSDDSREWKSGMSWELHKSMIKATWLPSYCVLLHSSHSCKDTTTGSSNFSHGLSHRLQFNFLKISKLQLLISCWWIFLIRYSEKRFQGSLDMIINIHSESSHKSNIPPFNIIKLERIQECDSVIVSCKIFYPVESLWIKSTISAL